MLSRGWSRQRRKSVLFIRGSGSQAASRPGAKSRCLALASKASPLAVQHVLSALVRDCWCIGPVVSLDKTEVIPACPSSQSFAPGDFQRCIWTGSSNFKLLGAPLGSTEWCEDLLGRRTRKARALLAAIGKFPDAQGAFCLLRSCSGWSKVIYSCRTVPPDAQQRGLHNLIGRLPPSLTMTGAWRPLVSRREGWELGVLPSTPRRRMWRVFPLVVTCAASSGQTLTPSTSMKGATLLQPRTPFEALSRLVPTSMLRAIPRRRSLCHARSLCHRRLHLDACRVPVSGAWLTANPSSADTHVPSPLFRTALQRRLRMPLWDHDSACSMCGEVLDRWGDHALSCGGDKILRHNAIRDVVCSSC